MKSNINLRSSIMVLSLSLFFAVLSGYADSKSWKTSRVGGGKSGNSKKYVIVTDIEADVEQDSYVEAVQELIKLRNPVEVITLKNDDLKDMFRRLKKLKPYYVAFVVSPERIESNFVGEIFEGMTTLDGDPYLDCAYGYITGARTEDAVNLVRNTATAEAQPKQIPKKFVAIAHSFAENDLYPFAVEQTGRYKNYGYQVAKINPVDNSGEWEKRAEKEIQKLDGASLVFLAGHGIGDMSCAIPWDKFGRIKLANAVIVNGTCYSAVTKTRHDFKDEDLSVTCSQIDPAKSVCLNFIKAGAVGQFACTDASSWMNVDGFAIAEFLRKGKSLGDAFKENCNNKIRSGKIRKIDIVPFQDGQKLLQPFKRKNKSFEELQFFSRVILIGDPAYCPPR